MSVRIFSVTCKYVLQCDGKKENKINFWKHTMVARNANDAIKKLHDNLIKEEEYDWVDDESGKKHHTMPVDFDPIEVNLLAEAK